MSKLEPVIFQSGKEYFAQLSQKYTKHKKGLFILAPSGAGKTYYCKNQKDAHWIDGDDLWISAGAHPDTDWWNQGLDIIHRVDKRSDAVTMEAMIEGFWVMGASNFWLQPSAIVIPDWETHKKYIAVRYANNYDGGATPSGHDQVHEHIAQIKRWHEEQGVPMFGSIEDAATSLSSKL